MTAQCLLSWDSYKNNICTGFSLLQQREEFVDMTIAADGHLVKVHRNIVALASPYIKEILQTAPCQHPVIFLHNISQEVLRFILEYIYTGEVKLPADKMDLFVNAAKALHVTGIEDLILPKHRPRLHKRRTLSRPTRLPPPLITRQQSSTNQTKNENVTVSDITKNLTQANIFSNLEEFIKNTNEVNNSTVEEIPENDIVDIDEEARGTYNYQNDDDSTSTYLKEDKKADVIQLNNSVQLSANQNFFSNDGNQNPIIESGINSELQSTAQNFINIRKEGNNFVIDTVNNSTDSKTAIPTTSDSYTNVNYPIVNDFILKPPHQTSNNYDWDMEISTNGDINERDEKILDTDLQFAPKTDSNVLPSITINLDSQNFGKKENNLRTDLQSASKIVSNVLPNFSINLDNQNLYEEENHLGTDLQSASRIDSNVLPSFTIDLDNHNLDKEENNLRKNLQSASKIVSNDFPSFTINLDNHNLDKEENNLRTNLQSASKIVSNDFPSFTINLDSHNLDINKEENLETELQSASEITSNVLPSFTINFDDQDEEENNLGTDLQSASRIDSNYVPSFTINVPTDDENLYINKASSSSSPKVILHYMVTNRGSLTLILNRYLYYMHNCTLGGKKRRWRCIDYRREGCKAFVDTSGEMIMKRKFLHAHSVHDTKIMKKSHDKPMFSTIQEALNHLSLKQSATEDNSRESPESCA